MRFFSYYSKRQPLLQLCVYLFVATGCTHRPLDLHTEFIGKEQLASYHVGTPDPYLTQPNIGQQLIIHWSLPPSFCHYPCLHLSATLRLYTGEERVVDYPLTRPYGTQYISLLNEEFQKTGGIITYKAQICSGTLVLTTYQHCLWNETVTVFTK